jgi:hypothetical protein
MTTTNPKDILKLIAPQGKSFHLTESSDIPSAVRALLLNDASSLTTFIFTLYIFTLYIFTLYIFTLYIFTLYIFTLYIFTLYIPHIIQYIHITSDFMSS